MSLSVVLIEKESFMEFRCSSSSGFVYYTQRQTFLGMYYSRYWRLAYQAYAKRPAGIPFGHKSKSSNLKMAMTKAHA